MILISACLLGIKCRYDGKILKRKIKLPLSKLLPVCPEQLGGLPTPRSKATINPKGRVINERNEDVTENFRTGAREVLKIARLFKVKKAILKANSPSCGKDGITAKRLQKQGIKVIFID
ncbi:MAG: DUF523 domain-containing protein [candidate division WOR-3 bacterium]